jgi:Zn-dependent peptidase ImmA (M78 family)
MNDWRRALKAADDFSAWVLEQLGLWEGGWRPPYVTATESRLDPEAPTAVAPIADRLGIAITAADISVDGVLLPHSHPPTALVNRDHAKAKQAFSAAHEIAHWLVLSDRWASESRNRAIRAFRDEERRSDAIAAALLMPLPWLVSRRRSLRMSRSVRLEQLVALADDARVSLSACLLRLHHTSTCRSILLNAKLLNGRLIIVADTGLPRSMHGKVAIDEDTESKLVDLDFGSHSDLSADLRVGYDTVTVRVDVRRTPRDGVVLLVREGLSRTMAGLAPVPGGRCAALTL